MKRIERGNPGYCNYARRAELLKTILMFTLVFAILIIGIVTTGSRMNLLTIVAVVGCLPAARYCVNFIARAPYHSLDPELVREIRQAADPVPVFYELMLGGKDKIRFVDCLAIAGHSICGYVSSPKADTADIEKHLRKALTGNGHAKTTVKLYTDKEQFLRRVDEMRELYCSEGHTGKSEKSLGHLITLLCL